MLECGHSICEVFQADADDPECLYVPPLPQVFCGRWPTGACINCGQSCVTRLEDGRYLHPDRCRETFVSSPGIDVTQTKERKGAYARFANRRG